MGSNDAALKRYYRSISKTLPCPRKMKMQIVAHIKDSVSEYLAQNPDADFEAVQNHFGTPEQIASSCVDTQDAPVLLRKMSVKKKVIAIVAGAVAVALLLWAGAMAWAIYDNKRSEPTQVDVTIWEE